jgi:hypothetical protein
VQSHLQTQDGAMEAHCRKIFASWFFPLGSGRSPLPHSSSLALGGNNTRYHCYRVFMPAFEPYTVSPFSGSKRAYMLFSPWIVTHVECTTKCWRVRKGKSSSTNFAVQVVDKHPLCAISIGGRWWATQAVLPCQLNESSSQASELRQANRSLKIDVTVS